MKSVLISLKCLCKSLLCALSVTDKTLWQVCPNLYSQQIPKDLLYFHEDIFIIFRLVYEHEDSVIQRGGTKDTRYIYILHFCIYIAQTSMWIFQSRLTVL